MGNRFFTKPPNDCGGPEITDAEIKALTFTGFTREELDNMCMEKQKTKIKKNKIRMKTNRFTL